MKALALFALTIIASSTTAAAQDRDPAAFARDLDLAGRPPFATAAWRASRGDRPHETYSLYGLWANGQPVGIAIRRDLRHRDGSDDGAVAWADSRVCPGLEAAVTALEEVAIPVTNVPGYGRDHGVSVTGDGIYYELWSRSPVWDDGQSGYGISMSGNVGTPVAIWVEGLRAVAADCWSETEPAP